VIHSLKNESNHSLIRKTKFTIRQPKLILLGIVVGCLSACYDPPPKKILIEIKPEWNLFSEQQDIQLGKERSEQFNSEVNLSQDTLVNSYIERLGNKLTQVLPDPDFPYTFYVIADPGLYTFAFPGGPVYITSGMIAATENESQLAGLIAHQLAHIALRHTTSKASKKARFRVRAAFVASSTGKMTLLESLHMIGMNLHPASELLIYAPISERNAATLAADIMFAAGYKPTATEDFIQVLRQDYSAHSSFFIERHSDFARPEQDASTVLVKARIPSFQIDTEKFNQIKAQTAKLQLTESNLDTLVKSYPLKEPVTKYTGPREVFITASYEFAYPATWKSGKPEADERFQVLPKGGMFYQAGSAPILSQGVIAGTLTSGNAGQSARATFIQNLQQLRPGLTVANDQAEQNLPGRPFQSILLEGDSPIPGEREHVWAIIAKLPDRVFYLLMITPVSQYKNIQTVFNDIFESIKLHLPETTQEKQ